MDKAQIEELAEEVQYLIDHHDADPYTAVNEEVGTYVNLSMTHEEHIKLCQDYANDHNGVFLEPELDLTDSFEDIIGNMADNVLCREVTKRIT